MYSEMFKAFGRLLLQLDKWLIAAEAFSQNRKVDPSVLLAMRLAPDQYPLSRQIQMACDHAELSMVRLTGGEARVSVEPDNSLSALRARIAEVVTVLKDVGVVDELVASQRRVTQPRWEGKWMTGSDYFFEHAVPNFFFHLTHSYALLRHAGVNLGKLDYLGALSLHAP